MGDLDSGSDLFNELAHEFAERYRRGERPPLSEYTDRTPSWPTRSVSCSRRWSMMEQFGSGAEEPRPGRRSPQPAAARPIPERLGDYRILREIGRGGMGIVYEAVQESLGRHVALKVLPQHRLRGPEPAERFQREARAAACCTTPTSSRSSASASHDGVHYYAMQYIQGQSLDAVLREIKRLRRSRAGRAAPCAGPWARPPAWRPAWRSSCCPVGSRAGPGHWRRRSL